MRSILGIRFQRFLEGFHECADRPGFEKVSGLMGVAEEVIAGQARREERGMDERGVFWERGCLTTYLPVISPKNPF